MEYDRNIGRNKLVPVLFLEDLPELVGIDGTIYGPYLAQDIATIPPVHAEDLSGKNVVKLIQ